MPAFKNAGVPVAEIAEFVALRLDGDQTLTTRYQLLKDHEANLKKQLQQPRGNPELPQV
ncbi:hypothetical protein [Limosilactobacillus fermentum]|uniref:hypothetical protein n=1 Tax=Limosilactobacillus fermentum TaxID=1613 RepID=UPI003003F6DE